MTEEELKLEALKYLENFKDCANCKHRWGDCADKLDEDCLSNNCYSATPKEQDIYLAGAEPREKRIAELEHQLTHRNCLDCSNHSSKLRMRTLELEKENAELKHIIATVRQEKDNVSMHAKAMEVVAKTRSEQLTKAKELLKQFLEAKNGEDTYKAEWEAQQFLKETE